MSSGVIVSVVMPLYNEERYIAKCIDSLLKQDYDKEKMEWIFVDGNSNDNTVGILNDYMAEYPRLIKIYSNPNKTVPYAMNIGIAHSSGKYIVRLDAHADYAVDYISKCIHYLETLKVENVGGVAITKASGFVGNAIAKMLSSKFGVGNSQFRTNGKSGYVDTVPFGAFQRDVFKKYGGYDERLTRNQDNEMNYRIRKNGGKIYMSDDIHLTYYCRDSIKGIARMARQNGQWNIITMKLCPGAMGIRHFIPMMFVLSIVALFLLGIVFKPFWCLLVSELALYLLLDILFSKKTAASWREWALLLVLFPVFHISYGLGSVAGCQKLFAREYRKNEYTPKCV